MRCGGEVWACMEAGGHWGGDGARSVQGEERTSNIAYMVVTLEVSKLSGWLNADAPCRESKGGYAVRGEVRGPAGGRCGTAAAQGSVQGRARPEVGGGAHGRSAP